MPNLAFPKEINLIQEMRAEYEIHARDEVPKLTNIKAVLAYDYFKYGWDAAIKFYSQQNPTGKNNALND